LSRAAIDPMLSEQREVGRFSAHALPQYYRECEIAKALLFGVAVIDCGQFQNAPLVGSPWLCPIFRTPSILFLYLHILFATQC